MGSSPTPSGGTSSYGTSPSDEGSSLIGDLGVIPDFTNEYRLYYLKQMHFGVPLTLYGLVEENEHPVVELDQQIVFAGSDVIDEEYEFRIYLNNELRHLNNDIRVKVDLVGRSIRKMVYMGHQLFLLTTDGYLFSVVNGDKFTPYHTRIGSAVADIRDNIILLKSGQLYFTQDNKQGERTETPEPIVSINGSLLLSQSGNYYKYKYISNSHRYENELVPAGKLDLEKYKWEFLDSKGDLNIERDGDVMDRSLAVPHMYFGVYTDLWRYFMVQVYQVKIEDWSRQYRFRGFYKNEKKKK